MRLEERVAPVGERRGAQRVLKERDRLKDLGVGGRIILKWILMKWDGQAWTGLIWLRIGTGDGLV